MREIAGIKQQGTSSARVAAQPLPVETSNYVPRRRSFRGGLYAVTPLQKRAEADIGADAPDRGAHPHRFQRPVTSKPKSARYTVPLLTTDEFIQVRLATVRESTRHCFWPIEVLERFVAADVIE